MILKPCLCQIANILWTSTHEVNMMSRMCLENDHWQKPLGKHILVEKNVWLKKCFTTCISITICEQTTNPLLQLVSKQMTHTYCKCSMRYKLVHMGSL